MANHGNVVKSNDDNVSRWVKTVQLLQSLSYLPIFHTEFVTTGWACLLGVDGSV